MVVDQACNQEFSGWSRFLEIRPLQETFQLQQTNKRPHWEKFKFFQLGTPKTTFLVRNLLKDSRNLGIFPNEQGHSFQFPKKSRGGLCLLPGSVRLLTYFKIFMSPSKAHP